LKSLIPLIVILFFLLPGCGKKGPPVYPQKTPVPAVSDLTYRIDGNIMTLTWTIPEAKGKEAFDGFIVYRYQRPDSDSPCKNCPKLFQQVANIEIDTSDYENRNMDYREEIIKGFVYTYKVVLFTKDGASGTDSNHVDFNY